MCSAATLVPPRHLGFSDVTHDSARVFWEGLLRPVSLFRVSFVSREGGHSGQVRAAPAQGPLGDLGFNGDELNTGGPAPAAPCTLLSWWLGVGGAPGHRPWPGVGER